MVKDQFVAIKINCSEDFVEIFIAELADLDFDSMLETDDGIDAYILKQDFDEADIIALKNKYPTSKMSYSIETVEEKNWNEEWEKNYDPIFVEDKILVRATFHKADSKFPYEIVINPKMSFGTGHHATTYLMLKNQMGMDHKGKRVLDAGCGTAILAVMAEKLGAKEILGYDNNAWSTENAPENVVLNNCTNIQILEGTIESLNLEGKFDIILANINKNVLLEEMPLYVDQLIIGGKIAFSGFYEHDKTDMINAATANGLKLINQSSRDNWQSLVFSKS